MLVNAIAAPVELLACFLSAETWLILACSDLREKKQVTLTMSVDVDDMEIAGNEKDCKEQCNFLNDSFPTNNLGEQTHYTGCAFTRNRRKGTLKSHKPRASTS